eukprot:6230936-Alexandrium_andersonii.AAC.2
MAGAQPGPPRLGARCAARSTAPQAPSSELRAVPTAWYSRCGKGPHRAFGALGPRARSGAFQARPR